jgi:hypothetical protein
MPKIISKVNLRELDNFVAFTCKLENKKYKGFKLPHNTLMKSIEPIIVWIEPIIGWSSLSYVLEKAKGIKVLKK